MYIELETPDNIEYQFHSVEDVIANFKVRAANNAHVALTMRPKDSDPILEIFIGGWGNTKSAIKRNHISPNVVEVDTPGILNADEFRGFWIRWYDAKVTVGREGETTAFMMYEEQSPFPINYLGVCTSRGSSGVWIIEGNLGCTSTVGRNSKTKKPPIASTNRPAYWISASHGHVPPNAMLGGFDGEQLYIARSRHGGSLTPGKLFPSHGVVYIGWGGNEHQYDQYEVLCGGNSRWLPTSSGNIPPHAMVGGQSETGEPLFIGRAIHNGMIVTGKIHPQYGTCFLPYRGQEISYLDYEVLIS